MLSWTRKERWTRSRPEVAIRRWRLVPIALAGVLCADPILAIDGVREVNQAKAMAGGITPSDTPGFPVTLDSSGSYRLTGVLDVSDLNATGIDILADRVSIDLNGFGIRGPGSGTGRGISTTSGGTDYIVRNGFVSGMGSDGIRLEGASIVDGVVARANGGDGVIGMLLVDITASSNGANGIQGRVIHRSEAKGNLSGAGLNVLGGVVSNSKSEGNDIGIQGVFGSVIRGNSLIFNRSDGIRLSHLGAVLVQNVVTGTDNGDGIDLNSMSGLPSEASLLVNNISADNGRIGNVGVGIRVTDQAILVRNATNNNPTGGIVGGNQITVIESQAVANGSIGISLGTNSLLIGNSTNDNTNQGILVGRQTVLVRAQSSSNGGHGIEAARDSLVRDSLAFGNTGDGIHADTSATIIGNNTNENTNDGIYTSDASLIKNNSSSTNGTGSVGNGIYAGADSNVSNNAARSNGAYGLQAASGDVGYSDNVFSNNTVADVLSGTDLGGNLCGGTPGC